MSIEISLIGFFPEPLPEQAAVQKAATALGMDPSGVPQADPRFNSEGLLVFSLEPDEEDHELTWQYFGFKSNLHVLFAEHSGPDDATMIRAWQNMIKIVLAFAEDASFRGELIEDYTDSGYLAHVSDGLLTLNQNYWQQWDAASDVLSVVPQPHHFADLHLMK